MLKHPELRKRDCKVEELARDCRELRNCGSQILKVRNRSSATFFSPQFRNRFGSPQYCGIADVRTKIADAHLCKYVQILRTLCPNRLPLVLRYSCMFTLLG